MVAVFCLVLMVALSGASQVVLGALRSPRTQHNFGPSHVFGGIVELAWALYCLHFLWSQSW